MSSEKFHNTSITIKGLLGLIEAKDIAIPEIQDRLSGKIAKLGTL